MNTYTILLDLLLLTIILIVADCVELFKMKNVDFFFKNS